MNLLHTYLPADEDDDNLLQGINSYRRSLNLPVLIKNDNAGCLADRIADDIEDLPCSSPTNGANILPSSQSPLANLPKHLRKCKIDANSTQDGVILPVCVPKLVPTLVLTNYTHSPKYVKYLNDSRFSGVGVGSEDNWAVVVLASSNPSGNFANAAGSLVSMQGIFVVSQLKEEEDKIFQGLNSFKQSLKKNSNAECLADEIADELEDQPCSSADDYAIEPGNGPKFPKFNKLIKKCHIDINTTTDGIILPVCVPNWDPDLVIKNYTHTQYAKYLNGSKYTGAGVGTEDDWVVVVLSTDTESGSFSGAPSLAAIGMVHYMMAMLLGLFLILLC
ncbi:Glycoprotein membrane precursor GPI-anchored protein [Prunus dulcis]|uniref:Glycoprotein membrane GPI-anchored protein n=1 Tax=Prunus dulcis TaxID=3755 RepID=A0A4Y1RS80_PRUDU|nr:Glycoprotein membrane precursor GPI-anchored protein [Prunus dulcis]